MVVGLVDKLSADTWVSAPWHILEAWVTWFSSRISTRFIHLALWESTLWMKSVPRLLVIGILFGCSEIRSKTYCLENIPPGWLTQIPAQCICRIWLVPESTVFWYSLHSHVVLGESQEPLFVLSSSLENIGEMRLCSLTSCGWKVCRIAKILLPEGRGREEFQLQLYQIPRFRLPGNDVSCIRCWKHCWRGSLGTWLGTKDCFLTLINEWIRWNGMLTNWTGYWVETHQPSPKL